MVLFFNLTTLFGWGQASVFSEVTVNKNNVFLGEAVELNIGVYTSTWFTKGVDIGNIKINGAFSVYFRSVSTSKKINGKNYAGVQFIYNIFPFENQNIVIPSMDVVIETPNEGDYKGIKRTLKTKEKTIQIKPFPPGINRSTWMVTTAMTVNEQWFGNTKNIKVGDVIERKISRRVNGTVVELIPPILWDSIANVSLYPSQSDLKTNKSKIAISAIRSDGVRYLFEEEGEVVIPDMEFVWWHPYRKQFLKKTIKGLTVNVQPNPDLDMLKTAKEALTLSTTQEETKQPEKAEMLIFGWSLKEFIFGVIISAVMLFLLIKMVSKTIQTLKKYRAAYKKSEVYAFKQFIRSVDSEDRKRIIPLLYKWVDQFNLQEPTLKALALKSGDNLLMNEVEDIEQQIKKGDTKLKINKSIWNQGRKSFLKPDKKVLTGSHWINP